MASADSKLLAKIVVGDNSSSPQKMGIDPKYNKRQGPELWLFSYMRFQEQNQRRAKINPFAPVNAKELLGGYDPKHVVSSSPEFMTLMRFEDSLSMRYLEELGGEKRLFLDIRGKYMEDSTIRTQEYAPALFLYGFEDAKTWEFGIKKNYYRPRTPKEAKFASHFDMPGNPHEAIGAYGANYNIRQPLNNVNIGNREFVLYRGHFFRPRFEDQDTKRIYDGRALSDLKHLVEMVNNFTSSRPPTFFDLFDETQFKEALTVTSLNADQVEIVMQKMGTLTVRLELQANETSFLRRSRGVDYADYHRLFEWRKDDQYVLDVLKAVGNNHVDGNDDDVGALTETGDSQYVLEPIESDFVDDLFDYVDVQEKVKEAIESFQGRISADAYLMYVARNAFAFAFILLDDQVCVSTRPHTDLKLSKIFDPVKLTPGTNVNRHEEVFLTKGCVYGNEANRTIAQHVPGIASLKRESIFRINDRDFQEVTDYSMALIMSLAGNTENFVASLNDGNAGFASQSGNVIAIRNAFQRWYHNTKPLRMSEMGDTGDLRKLALTYTHHGNRAPGAQMFDQAIVLTKEMIKDSKVDNEDPTKEEIEAVFPTILQQTYSGYGARGYMKLVSKNLSTSLTSTESGYTPNSVEYNAYDFANQRMLKRRTIKDFHVVSPTNGVKTLDVVEHLREGRRKNQVKTSSNRMVPLVTQPTGKKGYNGQLNLQSASYTFNKEGDIDKTEALNLEVISETLRDAIGHWPESYQLNHRLVTKQLQKKNALSAYPSASQLTPKIMFFGRKRTRSQINWVISSNVTVLWNTCVAGWAALKNGIPYEKSLEFQNTLNPGDKNSLYLREAMQVWEPIMEPLCPSRLRRASKIGNIIETPSSSSAAASAGTLESKINAEKAETRERLFALLRNSYKNVKLAQNNITTGEQNHERMWKQAHLMREMLENKYIVANFFHERENKLFINSVNSVVESLKKMKREGKQSTRKFEDGIRALHLFNAFYCHFYSLILADGLLSKTSQDDGILSNIKAPQYQLALFNVWNYMSTSPNVDKILESGNMVQIMRERTESMAEPREELRYAFWTNAFNAYVNYNALFNAAYSNSDNAYVHDLAGGHVEFVKNLLFGTAAKSNWSLNLAEEMKLVSNDFNIDLVEQDPDIVEAVCKYTAATETSIDSSKCTVKSPATAADLVGPSSDGQQEMNTIDFSFRSNLLDYKASEYNPLVAIVYAVQTLFWKNVRGRIRLVQKGDFKLNGFDTAKKEGIEPPFIITDRL